MIVVALNKKALHDYEISHKIDAGIVLRGDEIKSIRKKSVSLDESFAVVQKGEVSLLNCYIAPYSNAFKKTDDCRRSRKLLLHKREISRLIGETSRKGMTLVPLKLYINDRGYAKIELGIAKHKKLIDKRKLLKERDIARQTAREIKIKVR
jgi:SsrA-binding protein